MARVLLFSRMRIERSKTAWRIWMPLINVVVSLIVVGVLLWLVNNYIPMDAKIKNILNIVVVIAVVLWLLSAFGVLGPLSSYRVGR
jgi:hydrogenase-4 membrane subunit HyfE